jgi:hypothetical protein
MSRTIVILSAGLVTLACLSLSACKPKDGDAAQAAASSATPEDAALDAAASQDAAAAVEAAMAASPSAAETPGADASTDAQSAAASS